MNGQEKDELKAQYCRAIFDAIPMPAFIVDEDVRILDFNAAAEPLLGADPATALFRRGGEALHCIHAEMAGCGQAKACEDCVIRNSVRHALLGGATHRKLHQVELRSGQGVVPISLLVTASLLPYTETPQVLLILENFTETLARHAAPAASARAEGLA